jgi:Bacterial Ig-like domain (group 3)/FG-GAP-like repeat
MYRLILFCFWFLVSSSLATGQNPVTTSIAATPTTVNAGTSVGFTATVQPSTAPAGGKQLLRPTGTITLLDGTTPLNGALIALVPNGLTSAMFPQTFGTPDPTLTPITPDGLTSTNYQDEFSGDLNGDGVQDILIYSLSSGTFAAQTFTSNGKGGYTTSPVQTFNFAGCTNNTYIIGTPQIIDINGDGKADLLCGAQVAYGNGDGTFAQPVAVPFLSSGFATAYAADVNGDGKTDLLAVPAINQVQMSFSGITFEFTVFLNQGGGSFANAGTFPVAPISYQPGIGVYPPTVVDVNGDGKPDIIAQTLVFGSTQETNPQRSIDVLLGNGDGTFGTYMPVTVANPPSYSGGPDPYGVGQGDVNGDGKPDLILILTDTSGSLTSMVFTGNGDGTFQGQYNLTLWSNPGIPPNQIPTITVEDLNLDGKQDLIFGNGQVALGNGDGTFALSNPLFTISPAPENSAPSAFSSVQLVLPGSLAPSLAYLLPSTNPPTASVFTPQVSSTAAFSSSSLAAGTHSITAAYSGDANYSANTSVPVTVTVGQATSAVAVTSSVNPIVAGQSVTFAANVTSSGPTPTGNITFTAGSATLGTVALSGGSASYTTTSLTTIGNQTVAASYSGDGNTQASSGTLNQVVNAPYAVSPGTGSSSTLTVTSGKAVSVGINVAGTTGFSGQVAFACSGLPAGSSCSFSPTSVTVSGTSALSTVLSVTTGGREMAGYRLSGAAYAISLAALALFWPIRRRRALLLCLVALTIVGLNGCGSGMGSSSQAENTSPGTYSFKVTASSGSMQVQSAYTLVVQ